MQMIVGWLNVSKCMQLLIMMEF